MNNLSLFIDNIYSGSELGSESRFIHDSSDIYKECLSKTSSRYKLSGVNYLPYIITEDLFNKIFNNILLVPILTEEVVEDHLINFNKDKLLIHEFSNISDLLYENDLTTNGILAIRHKKCFGNEEFRSYVEDSLSKIMSYIDFDHVGYFIPNRIHKYIVTYNNENLTRDLVNMYGFNWRD